jgi:signal transduction histidine kinase
MDNKDLKRKLELEQLVADVAKKFIMVDEVTDALNEALEKIGRFSNASRAYLFEFDHEKEVMNNTFEWCKEGVSAEIDNLQGLPNSTFPWWMKKLKNGEVIEVHDVSLMSEKAIAEKEILEMQNILSVLVLPLTVSGELQGFIGFDNIDGLGCWTGEDQIILQMAAEVFSNAFARMHSENKLKETNKNLEVTLKKLQKTQSQLVQQEQMVAIGQLAAGVAHEINNPLAFMLSNQNVLKDYITQIMEFIASSESMAEKLEQVNSIDDVKDEVKKFQTKKKEVQLEYIKEDLVDLIEDVDMGIHRVSKIVEGLRYFSHLSNDGVKADYNIQKGVENTLVVAGSRLKHGITVKTNYKDDIPMIQCNGSEVNQVLLNIIMNAIDALDEVEGRDKKISISLEADKKNVHCIIEDNGCGMDEQTAKQVFNPFFTTKPIGSGTGLGMSIAYETINKNKGTISLDSKLGVGTKFVISLPIEGEG